MVNNNAHEGLRRKRARLACTACNARRVKCNVTESRPCHNCIAGNVVCETRESRRGKHPRRPKGADGEGGKLEEISGVGAAADENSPTDTTGIGRYEDEVAASHVLASLSSNFPGLARIEDAVTPDVYISNTTRSPFPIPLSQPETNASLSTIDPSRPEDEAAVFLGESTSLRYVSDSTPVNAMPTSRPPRLRHSIPNAVFADALIPKWEAERRCARMKALQADGAFSFPSMPVREDLLRAYFRWFHPHFAIVDESEVWKLHRDGTISPLLLQAMLFIGVIHCEDGTLETLDWGIRHRAKYLFYTRAKDIYDADYETKKLTVIQALFLMSFWRAGALWEKDARHWLSAAISLAQTKALHRLGGEGESPTAKLRRRLWWSIYVRERQCGSALGLPNRIRDEDCDIERLSRSDFEFAFDASTSAVDAHRYTTYSIGMMELAHTLGAIVDAGYLPNRSYTSASRSQLREMLFKWKMDLPLEMQLSSDSGEPPSFQASMLQLAYNNLLILLHRSAFINNEENTGVVDTDGNIALQAAARNSRIVEDMLSGGNIEHSQIHVITNLFNTLCIHVAHLRRSKGINRTIAEHRAKLCLLGLQELQRTWEVTNWVLQLFFQYLDRSTAARLAMEADETSISQTQSTHNKATPRTTANPNQLIFEHGDPAMGITQEMNSGEMDVALTPWSWTTDEANQYLFSQIENDFAFGEGGILDWSPDNVFGGSGGMIPDLDMAG
ncbi:hypothetical protein K505DRAFT_415012 [Melanomma pulvis-pyrius CBS 109.77]|uniref:Zn(2)-C6 fungal-type domain-containing protein n=1 Tax=Melanomma pulvis-pyrius CBS 109.77 TaxID=1314802 RepID=A0A6A6XMW3_9PLEO|nr:hypothetical protein K505DRAFT_415012 [Melanomma pulvis-pyrius CBS 109.77]